MLGLTFIMFLVFVALYCWFKLRKDQLSTKDGYFLGGRSLSGIVIAGSMLLTNISTEHLIGMNGSSYKNGFIIISWEITSAVALVIAAIYFVPTYLKLGLTTIPEYLEKRFDRTTRTMVALFIVISSAVTLLPIVLYTGAINLESIFNISEILGVTKDKGLWLTVIFVGFIGSVYAIIGGLKAVAYSDTIYGAGLLCLGLLIPILALWHIGDGNLVTGMLKLYDHAPQKFNIIGNKDSVLPFSTLFTGLMINQIYFWGMNQVIIQRALGAKNLVEAQKGLLFTGILKILVPFIVVLPGVIGFYYFNDTLYLNQDMVYPELIKKILPTSLMGLFAAVVMGAILSTFNSVLNSTATLFSLGIYQRLINPSASDKKLVIVGKASSICLAVVSISVAPFVVKAPDGLYQLLQQLNGIFFIPIATVILAGFYLPKISAMAAKFGLFTGLIFYIVTIFILELDIHFVHIWGMEFVLNLAVMFIASRFYPVTKRFEVREHGNVQMVSWKFAKPLGAVLILVTLAIYFWMGTMN